jgi:hypothetical protein
MTPFGGRLPQLHTLVELGLQRSTSHTYAHENMDIETKLVAPPDTDRAKRDGGPVTFDDPPKGDCMIKCKACGRVLKENVSMDYLRHKVFTCGACGAVTAPKGI